MIWEARWRGKNRARSVKNQISFTTLTFGYKTGYRHVTNISVPLKIPGKIIQITGGSMTRRRIWASLIPNISLVWLVKCGMRSGGTEVSSFRRVWEAQAETGLAKLCLGSGEHKIVACNATYFSCSLQKIPLSQWRQDWCQEEAGGTGGGKGSSKTHEGRENQT